MTVKELKDLLKDAPDHYDFGVMDVMNEDGDFIWPELPGDEEITHRVILEPRLKGEDA